MNRADWAKDIDTEIQQMNKRSFMEQSTSLDQFC